MIRLRRPPTTVFISSPCLLTLGRQDAPGKLFHITMDVLTDQLLQIEPRLGVANRITGLQRVPTATRGECEEFLSNNTACFYRRNRIGIKLHLVVDRQNNGGTIVLERNSPNPPDFDPCNFDCRSGL